MNEARLRRLVELSGHLPPGELLVLRLVAAEDPHPLPRTFMDLPEIAAAQRLVKRGLLWLGYDEAAEGGPSKGYGLTTHGWRALRVLAEVR